MCLAAMLDAGLLPPAERRILVLANGSMAPELTVPLDEVPGFPAWPSVSMPSWTSGR